MAVLINAGKYDILISIVVVEETFRWPEDVPAKQVIETNL
jgi:hypothetical protein